MNRAFVLSNPDAAFPCGCTLGGFRCPDHTPQPATPREDLNGRECVLCHSIITATDRHVIEGRDGITWHEACAE